MTPTRLGPQLWELPRSTREGMRVPARVWADEVLFGQIGRDRSLEQLVNVAMLPGVHDAVYAMPDAHEGYGFPVGGVAAFRESDGVISPGGVGYDINCGVRLLASDLEAAAVRPKLESLVHDLARTVPAGAGQGGHLGFDARDLDQRVCRHRRVPQPITTDAMGSGRPDRP